MFNLILLIVLVAVIFALSISVLLNNYRNKINIYFGGLSFALAIWMTVSYLEDNVPLDVASILVRLDFFMAVIMAMFFYLICINFPYKIDKRIKDLYIIISAVPFLLLALSDFTVSSLIQKSSGVEYVEGPLFFVVLAYIGLIILSGAISLVHKLKQSRGLAKQQVQYVISGAVITGISLMLIDVIAPRFFNASPDFTQLGIYSSVIFIGFIGYAVIKHQLFDVRMAIVRSVTYTLLVITLASIYLGLTLAASLLFGFGQASLGQNIVSVVVSLCLIFLFQPVKKFFDKITNRIFYKDNYNTDDFFAKLNKILGFTTDLRGLLERTATEIAGTLKGEQAFFFINTEGGHFVAAGTPDHRHLPKVDVDQLNSAPIGKNGVIIASLMDDNGPIKRMMISHRIELALPLVQDSKIIGYLFLGDHLTSSYTNRDIKVLNTISNELIIAIQNALAVQEIREFNITLQQRIANATRELRASNAQLRHLDKAKDEFLSMASHQLRTPLTSVKGYISMIIDGDVGRVSTDQKKLLGEAFNNSERMVGLINDFLSVSRIQTGRFVIDKVPIDLSLVVEQEVDSLRANASARQMELVYDKPDDCPIMDIDEGKIRQVIMNFIDNAIYYSHPNTKININLSVEKGEVLFTVKDTGIGVPRSERDQLFTKFYRASNAKKTRPDGTGVGLFLAKKVIDGHDGVVVFDSVEDKGSTFGFSLPIKPLVAAGDTNDLKN